MRPPRSCGCMLVMLALHVPVVCTAAEVTGDQVRQAVRQATAALLARQLADGTWPHAGYPEGATNLAVYALLNAGQPADSEPIRRALELIRRQPNAHTYTVSLKIMALTTAAPDRYRSEIHAAVRWLIDTQRPSGLWSYGEPGGERFDHSNTQFALLGLHAASQAGVKVPEGVWKAAQTGLLRTQRPDGGWAYQADGDSYGSMTAAGVANLVILGATITEGQEHGFRNGAAPNCGKYRINEPLARGLSWLARNYRAGSNPGRGDYYFYWLYAVERAGILSGQRFIGEHDWYREGANIIVRTQRRDGTWNGDLVDTCFGVLFLAKGHKALLIQKLQWSADDAWTPDRYDVEHLVAFIGDKLGEPVTWQSIPFDAPLSEWLAAPLLYFQGHVFPDWNEAQRAKLRAYVEQGGTILAEACCGREEFRRGFEAFFAQTFPEVPLRELGAQHAIYRTLFDAEPYGLRGGDYGCRTAIIYSPNDMSCLWEQGALIGLGERVFRLGANIAAYAVGKRPLRDRLDVVVIPEATDQGDAQPGPPPQDALRLAQVVYDGDWRPFPLALLKLAEFLRDEAGLAVVTEARQVRLTDEDLYACPILYLAGHHEINLTDAEQRGLADHLKRGGFLIADACCGAQPFDRSFRTLMRKVFPGQELERLPADHPIFLGAPGFDVTTVAYSPDVMQENPNLRTPELWGLRIDGRLAVILSPYSLGCGLSGPAFEGCWGLSSPDARKLAANIVLYAITH